MSFSFRLRQHSPLPEGCAATSPCPHDHFQNSTEISKHRKHRLTQSLLRFCSVSGFDIPLSLSLFLHNTAHRFHRRSEAAPCREGAKPSNRRSLPTTKGLSCCCTQDRGTEMSSTTAGTAAAADSLTPTAPSSAAQNSPRARSPVPAPSTSSTPIPAAVSVDTGLARALRASIAAKPVAATTGGASSRSRSPSEASSPSSASSAASSASSDAPHYADLHRCVFFFFFFIMVGG